jgi:hypothetical protein
MKGLQTAQATLKYVNYAWGDRIFDHSSVLSGNGINLYQLYQQIAYKPKTQHVFLALSC